MDLYDYLALVAVWILGAVYGWYARERHAERLVNRLVREVEEQVEREEDEDRILIVIEKQQDVFYIYNKENMSFMAQGKTKEEIEKILSKRFPGKRFAASPTNLNETGFYREPI